MDVLKLRYCVINGKIRIKSVSNINAAMDILVSSLKKAPEASNVTISRNEEICYIFDKPGLFGIGSEISHGKFKCIKKKGSIYIHYSCCPRYFKIMALSYVLVILTVSTIFFNISYISLESKIILILALIFFPPLMRYMISSSYVRNFLRKVYK